MNSKRAITHAAIALLLAGAASAQITGSVSTIGCASIVPDNRAAGGELFAFKTLNAGGGPDEHADWVFDLGTKGGGTITGTDVGAATWTVPDNFHHNTVPPEELFTYMTYPGGYLAVDSISMRGGPDDMGVVQRQKVGDSLPVGVGSGIGLVLPGDASSYTAGILDHRTGRLAQFPYGTAAGIQVAFSPIAEINSTDLGGSGCTIGGSVIDQNAGFGTIAGYNVYRVPGVPGIVPSVADFVGNWQYYIDLRSFDFYIPDTPGSAGPDQNGDGLPDGNGTTAPNDLAPYDLAGLHNPDGVPWTGDEVVIFQDSARNPDGTPRLSGTGPILDAGQGYWYVFQPVVFQNTTVMTDYDGRGFTRDDEFLGNHALDTDADGVFESLDVDMDGSPDFYSPQLVTGQTGLGLTNGGLPLLSAPVFGRANAAIALGEPRLRASVVGGQVQLDLLAGLETGMVVGYEITRNVSGRESQLTLGMIPARGGEGNVYTLVDAVPVNGRSAVRLTYTIERVLTHDYRQEFGPFEVDTSQALPQRRRR